MEGKEMIRARAEETEVEDGEALKVWDCGSPLYDAFELVSLTQVIERHLMTFPCSRKSNWQDNPARVAPASCAEDANELCKVPSWREIVRKRMWKRLRTSGHGKEDPKELKVGPNHGFSYRIMWAKIVRHKRTETGYLHS
ncbi:uncharacterized protein LOC115748596 [Rhodamnia argentea]|uniref:Uncharacterized protein LOC115748596 n=1 Tax=Rhodamnia argentea TaxID=178133 RepID=A0A8B8Q3P2_9MYRT|nr:uncharacterized protein LOC115748596 [Rhodamnia argentea]